jgi:hypothetical protein
MYQDTTSYADKVLSGFGLKLFVTKTDKLFEAAPYFISESMSYDEIIDDTPEQDASDSQVERKENELVSTGHSKVTSISVDLTEKSRKEPIDHLTIENLKRANYNLYELSMSNNVNVIINNMYTGLNTIYENATYFPIAQTYDVTASSTAWSTAATADPLADFRSCLDLFLASVNKEIDLSKITIFMSHELIDYIYATTAFKDWKNNVFQSDFQVSPDELILTSYFGYRVVILPHTLFTEKFVIEYVDKPQGTQTIQNNLLNSSSIITGFYNLDNLTPNLIGLDMAVPLNGIVDVLPGNIIMGSMYPRADKRGTEIDAMSINSVYVHNQKALARLTNIY